MNGHSSKEGNSRRRPKAASQPSQKRTFVTCTLLLYWQQYGQLEIRPPLKLKRHLLEY
jgi:hypothetical protein